MTAFEVTAVIAKVAITVIVLGLLARIFAPRRLELACESVVIVAVLVAILDLVAMMWAAG